MKHFLLCLFVTLSLFGCDDATTYSDAGTPEADASTTDAGPEWPDAGIADLPFHVPTDATGQPVLYDWNGAQAACDDMGMKLAEPRNDGDNANQSRIHFLLLFDWMRLNDLSTGWLGIRRFESTGTDYRWASDAESWAFPWTDQLGDCVYASATSDFVDDANPDGCEELHPAICDPTEAVERPDRTVALCFPEFGFSCSPECPSPEFFCWFGTCQRNRPCEEDCGLGFCDNWTGECDAPCDETDPEVNECLATEGACLDGACVVVPPPTCEACDAPSNCLYP